LIHRQIKVDGRWMDYIQVMKDTVLRNLLTDESIGDVYRYAIKY
jgi:hypothetical protein